MMVRCVYFILVCFALLLSGASAEEVDRPPVDPPADFVRKVPLAEPEPPGVEFDATRNIKTRMERAFEKAQLEQVARNENAMGRVLAALKAMKEPTLTVLKIREKPDGVKLAPEDMLWRFQILTRAEADVSARQEWDAAIRALDTSSGAALMCFEPGLALQWKDGAGQSLQAVVCLGCKWIRWEINGESVSSVLAKADSFSFGELMLKHFPDPEYAERLKKDRADWAERMKSKGKGSKP